MTYAVKVIADSIAENGIRLVTLQCTYPRYIHAEVMTHRDFARNASSSRAIPTAKLIQNSIDNMVYPIRWGLNQPGMQASDTVLDAESEAIAEAIWEDMAMYCAEGVRKLAELGLHKQWANRPLEWFGTITTVITSTNWDNWFELRDHEDAQPEIRHLAKLMRIAMEESESEYLEFGEWHLPYVSHEEISTADIQDLLKISTARCARVSYLTQEGTTPSIEKDIALYERLVGSKPLHASPCEHQACPSTAESKSGNLRGWIQHRKILEANGNISNV